MSLINQMLQDLDARRSDLGAGEGVPVEVRAVPRRNRIHNAWWSALVLVLLAGVGTAWLWGRQSPLVVGVIAPIAAAQVPAAPPAPSVGMAQSTATNDSAPQIISTSPASSVVPSVSAAPPAGAAMPSDASTAPGNQLKLDKQLSDALLIDAKRATEPAPAASVKRPAAPKAKAVDATPAVSRAPAAAYSDFRTPADSTKQVKELSPQQRAENEYRRAMSLIQQGRTQEAIGALEQALQIDAQHAAARQTLVELLLERRRHDDAMSRLQEGLGLDPNQPGLAMILARLQVEKGDIRSAVDTLRRTLPYAADRADYQAFLAALLQREGQHKEAIEHYGLALRKTPQNGVWWMGLGISLQADNRVPEARDAFGRAKATNTLSSELLAFVEQQLIQMR
jgi:MSHA biogenesis protein MshN